MMEGMKLDKTRKCINLGLKLSKPSQMFPVSLFALSSNVENVQEVLP